MLSTFADIAGILSFFMSIVLFILSHSLFKNAAEQRREYNDKRLEIQSDLIGLRDNIWEDYNGIVI